MTRQQIFDLAEHQIGTLIECQLEVVGYYEMDIEPYALRICRELDDGDFLLRLAEERASWSDMGAIQECIDQVIADDITSRAEAKVLETLKLISKDIEYSATRICELMPAGFRKEVATTDYRGNIYSIAQAIQDYTAEIAQ